MISSWKKHFLWWEFGVALLLASMFYVWGTWLGGFATLAPFLNNNRAPIYGTIAAIFGSLLGFVMTSMSIVLSVSGDERLRMVRGSKYYPTLWSVFTACIRALSAATLVSLVALVVDRDSSPSPVATSICFLAAILAMFRIGRCIWVLENIVNIVANAPSQPPT